MMAGRMRAIKVAMMLITINSSISVKAPRRGLRRGGTTPMSGLLEPCGIVVTSFPAHLGASFNQRFIFNQRLKDGSTGRGKTKGLLHSGHNAGLRNWLSR